MAGRKQRNYIGTPLQKIVPKEIHKDCLELLTKKIADWQRKRLILPIIAIFAIISCSKPEQAADSCDCLVKTEVNGVWNSQFYQFTGGCGHNGEVLKEETTVQNGIVYKVQNVVRCK